MNLASLLSMPVIARTKEAIYLRLPRELQEVVTCSCPHCKANNGIGAWDTLVVPIESVRHKVWSEHSSRVHMPNPQPFIEYMKRKESA